MSGSVVVGPHLRPRPGEKGFTLVELLVIIAILGVLAVIAIPQYKGYVNQARVTLAIGTLDTLRTTLEEFHVDYQEYPTPPVDFAGTGLDSKGRRVLPASLLGQLQKDVFSVDSYVLVGGIWTVTATARDAQHTVLTVTATEIRQ